MEAINQFLYMEIDVLWWAWIFITVFLGFLGMWNYLLPNSVPEFIPTAFLFGRLSSDSDNKFLKLIQVPKSWFTHFYAFAIIFNGAGLLIVCRLYFLHLPTPSTAEWILDILVPSRSVSTDPLAAVLVMTLFPLHTARRLFECLFISVYSKAHMNVMHYLLGIFFYFSVAVTLISEFPGFSPTDRRGSEYEVPPLELKWNHIIGILLYILATVIHHETHVTLANLRKNARGEVITMQHAIPKGRWFNYVSCPHFFAEILLYISIMVVLGFRHYGWWLLIMWVIMSQVVVALHTHKWYKEKHKDEYPKNRKAIIPFLL